MGMRGRKPKERESYMLRMGDGSLVEVTREVYLEWYQYGKRFWGNSAASWKIQVLQDGIFEESVYKKACFGFYLFRQTKFLVLAWHPPYCRDLSRSLSHFLHHYY